MYAEVRVLDGERIDRLVPGRPVALQVVTDPDPFAITKISQALALANHLPTSLACMLNPEGLLHTTAVLEEVSSQMIDSIYRKLTQLTCVISVEIAALPAASAPRGLGRRYSQPTASGE